MKLTFENIKYIDYFGGTNNDIEYCRGLLEGLLIDLETLNGILVNKNEENRVLYIEYINDHTEYSPERTDPCPDYYGMFRLRFESNDDTVGMEMTLDELDFALCVLNNFEE